MNRFQRFFEYGKLRLLRLVNPGKNPRTVTPGGRFAGFPPWHPRRTVPAAAAAVVLGVLLLIPHPVKAQSAGPDTAAFTTQGCTIWTVPADVSMVQIQAIGAAGAPGYTSPGGLGDGVEGVLSGLTGGDSLYVCVNVGGGVPGFSGGGGASGVALGADFSVPVLVAGGGGGGALIGVGGGAVMPVAASGNGACTGFNCFGGGGGGNNIIGQGGGGGSGCCGATPSTAGSASTAAGPGVGGSGGGIPSFGSGGGGGAGAFGGTTLAGCSVTSGAGTEASAGGNPGQAKVILNYAATDLALTADNDADQDGSFSNSETVPGNAAYPRTVTYRATVANNGGPGTIVSILDNSTATLTTPVSGLTPACATLVGAVIVGGATVTCYYDVELANATPPSVVNSLTVNAGNGRVSNAESATSTVLFAEPLAITLGWVLAEAEDDLVHFRWQTVTESGVAGFNVLAVTATGKEQLNGDLIPSPAIDALTPMDYAVSFATVATTFYLQEIGIDGSRVDHGPFEVGRAVGENRPVVTDAHALYLPIVAK